MSAAGPRTWPEVLSALIAGQDLDTATTAWAMGEVMSGEATPVQVTGLLVALRAKGETGPELAGLVESMLAHAHRIAVPGPCVDVVGTGGDRSHTVNISTMAALAVAGAGVRVVKHGNRAASSRCGSADLLEELGVVIALQPAAVQQVAEQAGITFCFAQVFHPAFRHAAVARRELGVPTAFNFLGPLTNPAQPDAQAVGCADARMAPVMADVLARRGTTALVFRGDDGLDELTTTTTSTVWRVSGGAVTRETLDPSRLGLPVADPEALRGGDAAANAAVARDFLAGATGPVRDTVLLNAAAALVALRDESGPLEDQLAEAVAVVGAAVDDGRAAAALQRWVAACRAVTDG